MIEKKVVFGSITIMEHKGLQVREDTIISEDGIELAKTYYRYIVNPGDDVSGKPEFIQNLSAFLWTPEVIERFKVIDENLRAAPFGEIPQQEEQK